MYKQKSEPPSDSEDFFRKQSKSLIIPYSDVVVGGSVPYGQKMLGFWEKKGIGFWIGRV